MRRGPLIAAVGAAVVAAALTVAILPASADQKWGTVVCDHRACLVLVALDIDADGDGVADVDEEAAGTDPHDPKSVPPPSLLLDLVVDGKSPSFESHLTELVVIPQWAPEQFGVATGLGLVPVNPSTKSLVFGDLLGVLGRNGFSDPLGVLTRLSGSKKPELADSADVSFHREWYADGLDGSPNGSKPVTNIVPGGTNTHGDHIPEFEFTGDSQTGERIVTHNYTVNYEDGSSDFVRDSQDEKPKSTVYTRTILSRNAEGKETTLTQQQTERPKTEPHDDAEDPKQDPAPKPSSGGEHMQDPDAPDYSTAVISGADMSRVISRINAVRKPGPDTGLTDVFADPPQDKRTWVALFAADGVTVFAAGSTPTFDPMQPDYDPYLQQISDFTGQSEPTSGCVYCYPE